MKGLCFDFFLINYKTTKNTGFPIKSLPDFMIQHAVNQHVNEKALVAADAITFNRSMFAVQVPANGRRIP